MSKYIHREGLRIILTCLVIALVVGTLAVRFLPVWLSAIIIFALVLKVLFVCRFFRVPKRIVIPEETDPLDVISPADGTVVAIEEVYESEILSEKRLQVSIFMSVWNVHINWYPIGGIVEYFRHHHGRFMVAWHPKSSTENERTSTVVRTGSGHRILFRQIAGYVARRIVNYAEEERAVKRGAECGFIKFGSRVDIFLPLESEVHVQLNQKVTGTQTRIATLPVRSNQTA